jgi:hypothetical protein
VVHIVATLTIRPWQWWWEPGHALSELAGNLVAADGGRLRASNEGSVQLKAYQDTSGLSA